MYHKIIINILLIICLVIMQISFISSLPSGLNNLNLILVILIFILGLVNLKFAAWWTVGAGLLLDLFSFSLFGVYLICLGLTTVIINFLLVNFFTNRSLYSFFAVVGLATVIYEALLIVVHNLIKMISSQNIILVLDKNFFLSQFSQLALNLLVTLIIFYFISFISKRLSPVFLVKRK